MHASTYLHRTLYAYISNKKDDREHNWYNTHNWVKERFKKIKVTRFYFATSHNVACRSFVYIFNFKSFLF